MLKNRKQTLKFWENYATLKDRTIVFYGEEVWDLTDFEDLHPAGKKAISCYKLQDVKHILFRIYPHGDYILDVLKRYRCGELTDAKDARVDSTEKVKGICKQKSILKAKQNDENKKVSFKEIELKRPKSKKKQKKLRIDQQMASSPKGNNKTNDNMAQNKHELKIPFLQSKLNFLTKFFSSKRISQAEAS